MKSFMQRVLIVFATTIGASTFAQGIIHFQNRDPAAGIDAPIYWTGLTKVDGSDPLFRAALLGGPKGSEAAGPGYVGDLQMLASPTTGVTWVGFLSGPDAGYLDVGTDTARIIPGVDWGQEAVVQIVAWHGNFTSWEEAFNAHQSTPHLNLGFSAPMDFQFPFDPSNEVRVRPLSFDFSIIPEPSTTVLAVLGGLLFLITRRRRTGGDMLRK